MFLESEAFTLHVGNKTSEITAYPGDRPRPRVGENKTFGSESFTRWLISMNVQGSMNKSNILAFPPPNEFDFFC